MAKLPDFQQLGETPVPVLPRRYPMIAGYKPTSGFEEAGSQELAQSGAQLEGASNAVLQAKIAHDSIRVDDMATQAKQAQMDLTYGKQGFALLKGADAVNSPVLKTYGDKFDAVAQQLGGNLDNDYQKQLFQRRTQSMGMQMREDIVRHVAQQTDVYAANAFTNGMKTDAQLAGARWDKPDSDVMALQSMNDRIERNADRMGLQGDARTSYVTSNQMAAKSQVYSNMVKAALVSDPVKGPFTAEAILKAHGADLDTNSRVILTHEVQNAVKPLEYAATAQDAVRSILPKVAEAVQVGGQPALDKLMAEVGPVSWRYRDPKTGEVQEGDASSAKVGVEAMQRNLAAAGYRQVVQPGEATGTGKKVDTMALMGEAVVEGERSWLEKHPGDLVGAQQVTQHIKSLFGTISNIQYGIQRQAIQTITGALLGMQPGSGGMMPAGGGGGNKPPTTMPELMQVPGVAAALPLVDPSQMFGIFAHLRQNQAEANGELVKSDPRLVNDLRQRIYLPEGDPNKITSPGQLIPYQAHGLNYQDAERMKKEMAEANTPEGNPFLKAKQQVTNTAGKMLTQSMRPETLAHPDIAQESAYRFNAWLDDKIKAERAAGRDPNDLFKPGSKDYVLEPGRVASFMPSESEITARAAGKVATPAQNAVPRRNPGETAAEYLKRIGR